ncbi:putative lipoprotein [Leptospira inadai serovar Lyme str. 10]|uniref:Putative lipoprotein n=1 Tax=Leptospira inadai serovar Lyme str. 10 TaxID=1049790 RepID=V6HDZ7_9LEPT|nr:hypothetical protein [Leptospira inadai]EQA38207.1 putative lipoprotein [Leptospira inadai serovar Lyme str. 10]
MIRKNLIQITCLLSTFLFASCSRMLWRPAGLAIERGWSETGKELVQTEVTYEERFSWNPLAGTSQKRNYKTKFRIYDLTGTPDPKGESPIYNYEAAHWTLPGSVYYHSSTARLFWIQGVNDEYGGNTRTPSVWSPHGFRSFEPKQFLSNEQTILRFVPSPDGGTAALLIGKVDESLEIVSPKLILADTNGQSSSLDKGYSENLLSEWKEIPTYQLRWSADSSSIYLRLGEHVVKITRRDGKLVKANEFPRCFFPPTNFGPVGISPAGTGGDSSKARELEPAPFRNYSDRPMVKYTDRIRDCSLTK